MTSAKIRVESGCPYSSANERPKTRNLYMFRPVWNYRPKLERHIVAVTRLIIITFTFIRFFFFGEVFSNFYRHGREISYRDV